MIELAVRPLFTPPSEDISRALANVAELGLAERPYTVIGVTALQLSGYVPYSGRTDVVTTPDEYSRLRTEENEIIAQETGRHGEENRKLIIDAGGRQPVHVIQRWHPASELRGIVTYKRMESQSSLAYDVRVVNPVTSIKWLLGLDYIRDESAARRALMTLHTIDPRTAASLFDRAEDVWSRY